MNEASLTISAKKLIIGMIAIAAAAIVAVFAFSQARPAEATGIGTKTLTFINKGENTLPSPLGFVFNSPLYGANDQVVGSDSGACELLPPRDGIADEYMCDTVFTLDNGTVTASGKQRLTDTTAIGAVTGGTGKYRGCEGTVIGQLNTATPDPADFKITLKLTECW